MPVKLLFLVQKQFFSESGFALLSKLKTTKHTNRKTKNLKEFSL